MRRADTPTFVYFARRADGEGPVKIGCSHWPLQRLKNLMCWAPYPLAIVATMPGDEHLERRFHSYFADQWSHSEWFTPSPEMTLVLAELAMGVFDASKLPAKGAPAGTHKRPPRRWRESQKAAVRLSGLRRRSGLEVPASVTAAAAALDGLSGDALAAAWKIINDHCAAPWVLGRTVLPYAWSTAAYARFAAKQGLPSLAEAA